MKDKFKESKELFESINKDLEKLTKLLEEICEEEKATYTMSLDYDNLHEYNKLNVSMDKTESVKW